jgi:signal transduction histidine kinase
MKAPLKILHLDDDPVDASLIRSTLESEGVPCATTWVQSREDFVAALENGGIDVILSDSALPSFDGMAALELVRARWPAIPLIFVSGTPGEERAVDLLKGGAADYVLKHRLARLAPAVRRAVQEAKERSQGGRPGAQEGCRASREDLRALAARIQAAREEERTRAAREIHDVLAQELTGLKMEVAWLSRQLTEPTESWKPPVLQQKLGSIQGLIDTAIRSVQRIAADLRPAVLDSLGLCAATEWVAGEFQKRTEIRCEALVRNHDAELDRDRATALFRILQESLTNISRHAQATKVGIRLWQEAGEVALTVFDNGRGIAPEALKDARSLGLLGMRERAALLGGQCTIRPQAGGGTLVEARLPIIGRSAPA